MPLLAYVIATDPQSDGARLTAAAAMLPRPVDPHTAAALLAHPNLPATVDAAPDPQDVAAVHAALRQPHTTPASRARLLTATPTPALCRYLVGWDDLVVDAVAHLAARDPGPDLDDRIDWWRALVAHPATPAEVRGRCLTGLLTNVEAVLRTPRAPFLTAADAYCDQLITIATLYPEHLQAAADAATRSWMHTDLTRLAANYRAGRDVHAERIADLRPADDASQQAWVRAIYASADAGIALAALERFDDARIRRAIKGTPQLSGTAAYARARVREAALTAAGYPQALAQHARRWSDLTAPELDLDDTATVDDLEAMWLPARTLKALDDADRRHRAAYVIDLVLHPASTPTQQAYAVELLRADIAAVPAITDDVAGLEVALAVLTDTRGPVAAVLDQQVSTLAEVGHDDGFGRHLRTLITAALHAHAPHGTLWLTPALALGDTFAGSLRELLMVAATVPADLRPSTFGEDH